MRSKFNHLVGQVHWECLDSAQMPSIKLPRQVVLRTQFDFATDLPTCDPVDALVSNFGLEYVTRRLVVPACARWLKPSGRLCALVHSTISIIDKASAQSLDDLDIALQPMQVFSCGQRLLGAMTNMPLAPEQRTSFAVEERTSYNAAVDALKQHMVQRGERSAVWIDILTALSALIRQAAQGQPAQAFHQCNQLMNAYAAEAKRLRAMRASAVTEADRLMLTQSLTDTGFRNVEWHELRCTLGTVGWSLQAVRAA
jgi:hypothetical protein